MSAPTIPAPTAPEATAPVVTQAAPVPAPAPVAAPPVATPAPVAAVPAEPVRILNPWAKKTPAPPVDPRVADLEARVAAQTSTLSTYAAAELASVTEGVRNAVRAIAGDDPAAQLNAIAAMRANGLGAPTIAAGSNSAPQIVAPAPAAENNPDALELAHYEKLRASGAQLLASQFSARNAAAIARAASARASRN